MIKVSPNLTYDDTTPILFKFLVVVYFYTLIGTLYGMRSNQSMYNSQQTMTIEMRVTKWRLRVFEVAKLVDSGFVMKPNASGRTHCVHRHVMLISRRNISGSCNLNCRYLMNAHSQHGRCSLVGRKRLGFQYVSKCLTSQSIDERCTYHDLSSRDRIY